MRSRDLDKNKTIQQLIRPSPKGGWLLGIRLTPNAPRNGFKGLYHHPEGKLYLKAMVSAVPENGLANKALIRMMSKAWHIPQKDITLQVGATDRLKVFHLSLLSEQLEEYLNSTLVESIEP